VDAQVVKCGECSGVEGFEVGVQKFWGCRLGLQGSGARRIDLQKVRQVLRCTTTAFNTSFDDFEVASRHLAPVAKMLVKFLLLLLCACIALCAEYREHLLFKPLPHGALLASFNFQSNASSLSFEQQNFRYFPRSLGQILQHAHTKELHMRFSLGRWDDEEWGARPWNGAREGGTGVELWAWVDAPNNKEYAMETLTRNIRLLTYMQSQCKMADAR
jgi:hypothetical protein